MMYTSGSRLDVNCVYDIDSDTSYMIVGYHRGNPNNVKSIWHVSHNVEIECFIDTYHNDRISERGEKRLGWSIYFQNEIQRIGIGVLPGKKPLYIAQFKNENGCKQWHGYPIDYEDTDYRIPDKILYDWEAANYINKR